MSKPVAIVTGAGSGIGEAVATHLYSKGYKVVIAELNPSSGERVASNLGPDAIFHQTDVASYKSQAQLFKHAYEWGGNRLDFCLANAGIDDRQNIFEDMDKEEVDEDGLVKKLNTKAMEVNLEGVVGLCRASGPVFVKEGITVNTICPAFVPTNLCPPEVAKHWPKEHITPMSTVNKAIDAFLADDTLTGQAVELSQEDLYFRQPVDYPNESQRWISREGDKLWNLGYREPPKRQGY